MTGLTHLNVRIYSSSIDLAHDVAMRVVAVANECQTQHRQFVLGLAGGKSPMGIYRALALQVRLGHLNLSHCIAFGLDEYYPTTETMSQRFAVQLTQIALSLGIHMQNLHLLHGDTPIENVKNHCRRFEKSIQDAGGIDFQLLGIGQNGHIAFNEPGSAHTSRTRLVELGETTRKSAQTSFGAQGHIPSQAVTMGVATILEAKEIALVAFGESKSAIVQKMITSIPSSAIPASFLQTHPNANAYLDDASASFVDVNSPAVSLYPFQTKQPGRRRD